MNTKKYIYILILFIFSCTEDIELFSDSGDIIESTFISYNYDSDTNISSIYAQLTINYNFLDIVRDIWVEIEDINNDSTGFLLNDEGVDGDAMSGNGIFSLVKEIDILDNGVYNATFYIVNGSNDTDSVTVETISTIFDVGLHSPVVNQACVPEFFITSQEVVDSFYVSVSISDLNGFNDIKSVVLEMKKLQGYEGAGVLDESGNCVYEQQQDDNYMPIINMSFVPDISLLENCGVSSPQENVYIYTTGLSIDPYNGGPNCGPHGPVSFRFKVTDYSNFVDHLDKDILICWTGDPACE